MYALIVDDETRARETIIQIIKLYCPEITSIQEATSVQTAVESIKKQKPDLLLLDIRLDDGSGFDILKKVNLEDLNIIFITAYDEYAVKAFKVSAIDYLLKPIDPDEFIDAVSRVQKRLYKDSIQNRMDLFLNNLEQKQTGIKKITLKTTDHIYIVSVDDIIYCEADKNYTTFFLKEGEKVIVSRNLKEYEELLPSDNFLRVHQSFLVNVNHIIRYDKGDKNCLITTEEYEIPVSSRKRDFVIQFLSKLG